MAEPGRKRSEPEEQNTEAEEQRIAEEAKQLADAEPERRGDVLGLSDAPPEVEIPQATKDHSGNPAGIEVRKPTTGTSELKRSKGATGIDMGAAGSGTDIDPTPTQPTRDRHDIDE